VYTHLQADVSLAFAWVAQKQREEPHQNPNKSEKKMFFFHGNFYMIGTGIEKWTLFWLK